MAETSQGIEQTPYDPEFAKQMEAAERVMREDRDALQGLAQETLCETILDPRPPEVDG